MPQIIKVYCDATFLPKRGKQSNRPNAACGIVIAHPDKTIRIQEKIYRCQSSGDAEAIGALKAIEHVRQRFGEDISLVIFNDSEELCFSMKKMEYPWHDKCKTGFSESIRSHLVEKMGKFNHACILYKHDSDTFMKEAHNLSRGCVHGKRQIGADYIPPRWRKRTRYIMRKFMRMGFFD